MANYIGAIDQGTTSTRFIVFDHSRPDRLRRAKGTRADLSAARLGGARRQRDLAAHPRSDRRGARAARTGGERPGRHRHHQPARNHRRLGPPHRRAGLQRARLAGHPHGADAVAELARNGGGDRFRAKTGLPLATYFSALKIRWVLDNVAGARARAEAGDVLFGNIDTFLLWNLTGGLHVTDCTNASRTQLMNLETLDWDDELLEAFRIPRAMLPRIALQQRGLR